VPLKCLFTVGALDIVLGSVLAYSKQLVEIFYQG
jgi:hypothetical protein